MICIQAGGVFLWEGGFLGPLTEGAGTAQL